MSRHHEVREEAAMAPHDGGCARRLLRRAGGVAWRFSLFSLFSPRPFFGLARPFRGSPRANTTFELAGTPARQSQHPCAPTVRVWASSNEGVGINAIAPCSRGCKIVPMQGPDLQPATAPRRPCARAPADDDCAVRTRSLYACAPGRSSIADPGGEVQHLAGAELAKPVSDYLSCAGGAGGTCWHTKTAGGNENVRQPAAVRV